MIDAAFFDRFPRLHSRLEIPKMRPEFLTNRYGLIVDYLAEWLREMRNAPLAMPSRNILRWGRDVTSVIPLLSAILSPGSSNCCIRMKTTTRRVRRCLEYAWKPDAGSRNS